MPRPAWDNLDAFLGTRDFAVTATVTPQGGRSRPLVGIFDNRYLNGITGEYEADSSRARLECKQCDTIGLRRGDVIAVPGEGRFELITEPQKDGTGMVTLDMVPAE